MSQAVKSTSVLLNDPVDTRRPRLRSSRYIAFSKSDPILYSFPYITEFRRPVSAV